MPDITATRAMTRRSETCGTPKDVSGPKVCITEFSVIALVAISLGVSVGIWLSILAAM